MNQSDSKLIREAADPLEDLESAAIDALIERIGDARLVLLGESTHGTSEFYRTRARISRALIERRGFDFVAVEADWPDAMRINHYVSDIMSRTTCRAPRSSSRRSPGSRPGCGATRTELASHYFDASLPLQFDELIWFDETRAVEPLAVGRRPSAELPETYPFGL